MEPKLTFQQGFKIWWSYAWRTFVLAVPFTLALVVVVLIFVKLLPQPIPGEEPKLPLWAYSLWPIFLAGSISVQVFALRWTLQNRWSDFRLVVVKPEKLLANQPEGKADLG